VAVFALPGIAEAEVQANARWWTSGLGPNDERVWDVSGADASPPGAAGVTGSIDPGGGPNHYARMSWAAKADEEAGALSATLSLEAAGESRAPAYDSDRLFAESRAVVAVTDTLVLSEPATVEIRAQMRGGDRHELPGWDERPESFVLTNGGVFLGEEGRFLGVLLSSRDASPDGRTYTETVELPAGASSFKAELAAELLTGGTARGPGVNRMQASTEVTTTRYEIVVPPGVMATSGTGRLPIVRGAPEDRAAPTVTASLTPQANSRGWLRAPTTVVLESTDGDGSGVQELVYSATGAEPIGETRAPAATVSFPVTREGITTVTYVARDRAGNASEPQTMIVRIDRTAPSLRLPAPMSVDATGSQGATVRYEVTASDGLDASPSVACVPPSGAAFRVGPTRISCVARDAAGNESTGSFIVTVRGASEQLARLVDRLPASVPPAVVAQLRSALTRLAENASRTTCAALGVAERALRVFLATGVPVPGGAALVGALVGDLVRIRAVLACQP
jgi:hypothetical protein